MEVQNITNLKTNSSKSANKNDFFKKINPYNITGINDYKNQNKSQNKTNLLPLFSNSIISNKLPSLPNEDFSQSIKDQKLSFIKNLIKKPKDRPYDGYASFRKKPTINFLLKKFEIKEDFKIFEENQLCKIPYPLIKFISNRKSPNQSKELITDILSAELNDLSASQKNDIKYKNYKKPIKIRKLKLAERFNNSNFSQRLKYYSNHNSFNNNKDLDFPFLEKNNHKSQRNKKIMIENSFNRENYSCLTADKPNPCYNDRRIKKKLIQSYCGGDYMNLTEHSTLKNNISILKNDISKKLKYKNPKFNDILKDISLLKENKHIMAFEKK